MPVYNSEIHLKEALISIINQTFKDFELICVDDGSTDSSIDILNEFSFFDSRVKVISQKNKGAGAARNVGLKNISGEYVCFIDSDDYMVPTFLEETYNNLKSNDSDIVFYKIGNIKNNKKVKIRPYFSFDKKFQVSDFDNFTFDYRDAPFHVLNYHFAPWTKVCKKEFLDKYDDFLFDEHLPYEDILFHVKAMLRASKISFVPKYLYYYRLDNPDSLSFYNQDHIKIFEVVDNVGDFLRAENHYDELKDHYEFFQLIQVTRHIAFPVDENYYKQARLYASGIELEDNEKISNNLKKRYRILFDNENPEDYEKYYKRRLLVENHAKLKNRNKRLKKQNKNLKKELKNQKNLNKELLTSRSWKSTASLRKIKQTNYGVFSMKKFLLNQSNSYNYYKDKYDKLQSENKKLNKRLKRYEKKCPICGYKGTGFKPYPQIIHREVECPKCKSHERHRALWLYFQQNPHLLSKGNKFLHFAPEDQFQDLFRNSDVEYHPVDITSENWQVDEIVDIQNIPYDDNHFDLIYCSHVLEHVPDDKKAMSEIHRVLKPGGIALILAPINGIAFELPHDETKTLEDDRYNTPELRDKYYGQFDHLRLYGSDFKERLIESGFTVKSDDFIKRLGFKTIERYALIRDENIFECTK